MVQLPRFSATLFALFVSANLILSGCTDPGRGPVIQTRVAEVEIPPSNRVCPAIPIAPDPDDPETTQRDIAVYLIELTQIAEHCKRDLNTTVAIVDDFNSTAAALNAAEAEESE